MFATYQGRKKLMQVRAMYHKCNESLLRETKYHARKFLCSNEVEKEKVWLKRNCLL